MFVHFVVRAFTAWIVISSILERTARASRPSNSIDVQGSFVAMFDDAGVVMSLAPPQLTRQYTLTLHSYAGVVFAPTRPGSLPPDNPIQTNSSLDSHDNGLAESVHVEALWPWGTTTALTCWAHKHRPALQCTFVLSTTNSTLAQPPQLVASFTSAHQDVLGMHCGPNSPEQNDTHATVSPTTSNTTHTDLALTAKAYKCLVHMERESVDIALSAVCASDYPMQATAGLDVTWWSIGPLPANATQLEFLCEFALLSPSPDERARRVMLVSICTIVSLLLSTSMWIVQRRLCGTMLVASRGKYTRI